MSGRGALTALLLGLPAVIVALLALALGGGDDEPRDSERVAGPSRAVAVTANGPPFATIERLEGGRWRAAAARVDGDRLVDPAPLPLEHPVAIARQGDRLVIAGERVVRGRRTLAVTRMDDGGRIDRGFGRDGVTTVAAGDGDAAARGVAVDSGGTIAVVGDATFGNGSAIVVARLSPEGEPAPRLGRIDGATAAGAATTADGAVVVAGTDTDDGRPLVATTRAASIGAVARAPTGLRSASWRAVAATPDGGVVVVGSGRDRSLRSVVAVQRFGPGAKADGPAVISSAGEGDAYGNAVAVSGARVLIGAAGDVGARPASFLLSLEAGGGVLRAARGHAPGRVAAVGPNGELYVTRSVGAMPTAAKVHP